MDLIKIYEYSGVPTYKLVKILNGLKFGSEEYEVINHIIKKRYDRKQANFSREAVSQLIYEHQKDAKNILPVIIGSKNSEYCTEAEMINGFSCTYLDLSPSEKAIYNRL